MNCLKSLTDMQKALCIRIALLWHKWLAREMCPSHPDYPRVFIERDSLKQRLRALKG